MKNNNIALLGVLLCAGGFITMIKNIGPHPVGWLVCAAGLAIFATQEKSGAWALAAFLLSGVAVLGAFLAPA
jgi:hypothetical protein